MLSMRYCSATTSNKDSLSLQTIRSCNLLLDTSHNSRLVSRGKLQNLHFIHAFDKQNSQLWLGRDRHHNGGLAQKVTIITMNNSCSAIMF